MLTKLVFSLLCLRSGKTAQHRGSELNNKQNKQNDWSMFERGLKHALGYDQIYILCPDENTSKDLDNSKLGLIEEIWKTTLIFLNMEDDLTKDNS